MAIIESQHQHEYQSVYIHQFVGYAWDYISLGTLHESSGTVVLQLPALAPGDRFSPLSLEIEGMPFQGLLKNWHGVAALPSAQKINSAGGWVDSLVGEYGFILDLGGLRSVLELRIQDLSANITCVLPWIGTDFAPGSLYPAHGTSYPQRHPDTTGTKTAALRGAQSQKFYVQLKSATSVSVQQVLDHLIVVSAVYPQNLRARLDGGNVFWTHPGELRGKTQVTGLNDALNALTAELETGATPNLVLETDAPGVLLPPENPFAALVPEKGTEATWAGSLSTDVDIQAGEAIALPLIFGDDASGNIWQAHSLRITGNYEASPWRMEALESPQVLPARMGLKVDAHFAAARSFTPAKQTELHGFGLPLASPEGGSLLLELHSDLDGLPSGEALTGGDLVAVPDAHGSWYEALFEEPLQLEAGMRYWVLLKAREGGARWLAMASDTSDSRYSEEGGAWSGFPPLFRPASATAQVPQAMLRLLRLPYPEESDALLSLELPGKSGPLLLAWNRRKQEEPMEWAFPPSDAPLLGAPSPGESGRTWHATLRSAAGGSLELEHVELFFHVVNAT